MLLFFTQFFGPLLRNSSLVRLHIFIFMYTSDRAFPLIGCNVRQHVSTFRRFDHVKQDNKLVAVQVVLYGLSEQRRVASQTEGYQKRYPRAE